MIVQHNLSASNANRMLGITTGSLAKSTEKLSSGYRINRAADDAAGLSISEKMRTQIRGLNQASANAQDGISCVQTAEGALTEVHSMLQRMNELAVQGSNGTMSEDDRTNIQDEIDQLTTEINRVSATTKFNELYLLKGNGVGDYKSLNASKTGTGTGISVSNDTTNGLATIALSNSTKYGDDADGTITVGGVDYDLKDYANSEELVADISNNAKVTSIDEQHTYSGYETADILETQAVANLTFSGATGVTNGDYDSLQEVSFTLTVGGALASDTFGVTFGSDAEVTIDTTAADTQTTINIKMANALKEAYGEENVTVDTSSNTFSVKLAANTSALNIQAARDVNALKVNLHVGADAGSDNKIGLNISSMDSDSLGISGLNATTEKAATRAIDTISDSIKYVSSQRSALGAVQNRLEHTIANLDNVAENTSSAESRIRDVDMAEEMVNYSKNSILLQAGQSMLAQANQSTQGVLSLLQ